MSIDMIAIWHTKGTRPCHEKAFYYEAPINFGDVARSDKAQLLDGTRPKYGDRVHCGSCGKTVGMDEISYG